RPHPRGMDGGAGPPKLAAVARWWDPGGESDRPRGRGLGGLHVLRLLARPGAALANSPDVTSISSALAPLPVRGGVPAGKAPGDRPVRGPGQQPALHAGLSSRVLTSNDQVQIAELVPKITKAHGFLVSG